MSPPQALGMGAKTSITSWYPSRLLAPSATSSSQSDRAQISQQHLHLSSSALSSSSTTAAAAVNRTIDSPGEEKLENVLEAAETIETTKTTNTTPYAIMILNQPINKPALCALLPRAALVVCADAGGDRYREFYEEVLAKLDQIPQGSGDEGADDGRKDEICIDDGDDSGDVVQQKQRQGTDQISVQHKHDRSSLSSLLRNPDAVVGDLDSLTDDTRQYWSQRGVAIVHDPDQYSTDFAKCLKWLRMGFESPGTTLSDTSSSTISPTDTKPENLMSTTALKAGSADEDQTNSGSNTPSVPVGPKSAQANARADQNTDLDVLVLGGLGGRVDQGFSQIHHLIHAQETSSALQGKIYLVSEQSLTFVLEKGENVIWIDDWETQMQEQQGKQQQLFTENVGIIPITGPSIISTKGLEWDVTNWPTSFGTQISTSNHIRSDKVTITIGRTKAREKRKTKIRSEEQELQGRQERQEQQQQPTKDLKDDTDQEIVADNSRAAEEVDPTAITSGKNDGNGDDNSIRIEHDHKNKDDTNSNTNDNSNSNSNSNMIGADSDGDKDEDEEDEGEGRGGGRVSEGGKCIFTMEFAQHLQLGSPWPVLLSDSPSTTTSTSTVLQLHEV